MFTNLYLRNLNVHQICRKLFTCRIQILTSLEECYIRWPFMWDSKKSTMCLDVFDFLEITKTIFLVLMYNEQRYTCNYFNPTTFQKKKG
jgi:hypothetical protein